ncbi:hypothetical protein QQ045_029493 [Rhodiola kirilowii]
MDKFVIRYEKSSNLMTSIEPPSNSSAPQNIDVGGSSHKRPRMGNDIEDEIISDPALRKPITSYEPRIRDDIRREYVLKGPCQPLSHNFKRSDFGNKSRCFQVGWFTKWEWLEYSVSKDAAFCFWCYLFRGCSGRFGEDTFVKTGISNWKKACDKFKEHVGAVGSAHNDARTSFFAFKDQRQSLTRKVASGNKELGVAYRIHLTASVDIVRLLLCQGLSFRGDDESASSLNRGNFLEVLDWFSKRNVDVGNVVKKNAPANHQLTCPSIQKDIISACASETTKVIICDVGNKLFSILIDEARDSSIKEQMAIVLRFVDDCGVVKERFVGVIHVVDTTALSLKSGVDEFFC